MIAGDPAKQWEWHEAHRDAMKNMYRTSYSDMSHNREAHVRSDFPSGYGGHVRSLRFDVLHRNTAFDRNVALQRGDPSRDAFPSYEMQIAGMPSVTQFPCGARKNPTKGVVPHSGSTTNPKPPYGLLTGSRKLNQRTMPPTFRTHTMGASASSPALGVGRSMMMASQSAQQMAPPEMRDGPPSPNEHVRRTVTTANRDAQEGRYPTEAEVLAEQMEQMRGM